MILQPCFWGRILVLITSLLVSNASDPCNTYKSLDNPYRSTGYVARKGIDPMICDYDLQTGWYRFVNEVGGKMPETGDGLGKGHCGTNAPIWMGGGKHPSSAEDIVDRTACVKFNNRGCIPIPIKIKNCTDFFVYRLVAPYGCQMAYCAGTLKPCPRGQSGLFPNCTVLQRADFPFDQVPVPSVTYIDDTEIKPTLNCDFTVPPWGNVSFEIQWFVNGTASTPAQCDDPATSQCSHFRDYHLGSHIRCEIRAKYNTHPNNSWTQAKSSEIFYAGIEVQPTHLSVLECNASYDNSIRLRPTLPIRGDHDIKLTFGTKHKLGALLFNKCKITLKRGEEHKWTKISIQAVCDNTNRIYGLSWFTFAVTDEHDFWTFTHETSPVTIAKVENPVGNCIATGDPHYTTFDGKYYDFYRAGDFVLYRNKDRAFEIHTRLWSCWGVTCNCGVAIREKHDVIVLTTCTQDLQMTYGMPMKVLITSQRQLTRGTKIFVRHPGSYSEYEFWQMSHKPLR